MGENLKAVFGVVMTLFQVFLTIVVVNLLFGWLAKKKVKVREVAKESAGLMSNLLFYCFEFLITMGVMLKLHRGLSGFIEGSVGNFAMAQVVGLIGMIGLGTVCFVLMKKMRKIIFDRSTSAQTAYSVYISICVGLAYLIFFFGA